MGVVESMKKNIESQIRVSILEIFIVLVFTIVSIPLWDYIGNQTYAEVADHYSNVETSNVVITNRKKYIYAESYKEAIDEKNMAFITSYADEAGEYDIYLVLDIGTNYDDIIFSNGIDKIYLKDMEYNVSDHLYFKVDTKYLNSKETLVYNYYIWTKNLKKDKNIKIKFAVL